MVICKTALLNGLVPGPCLTQEQKAFNKSMSDVTVSAKSVFKDIISYFKFLDFKKNLKIGLSAVGKVYLVCALMHNWRTYLYGNQVPNYFDFAHPDINTCLS